MDRLQEYSQKWNLSAPVFMEKTITSELYKVRFEGAPAVLKILSEAGQKYEAKGALVLKCFNGNGAVKLLNSDEGAHLLEFIDGPFLFSSVQDFASDRQALEVIADVVQKLHSYSGEIPTGLISMKENFRQLFSYVEKNPSHELFAKGAKVAKELLATERNIRVLHGDIHHKNIMKSSFHGWVAIDPACIYGEETYDLANSFFNPFDMPDVTETPEHIEACVKVFTDKFKIERQRLLEYAFAFGCLSTVWCIEDGISPDRRLRSTKLIHQVLFGSK